MIFHEFHGKNRIVLQDGLRILLCFTVTFARTPGSLLRTVRTDREMGEEHFYGIGVRSTMGL